MQVIAVHFQDLPDIDGVRRNDAVDGRKIAKIHAVAECDAVQRVAARDLDFARSRVRAAALKARAVVVRCLRFRCRGASTHAPRRRRPAARSARAIQSIARSACRQAPNVSSVQSAPRQPPDDCRQEYQSDPADRLDPAMQRGLRALAAELDRADIATRNTRLPRPTRMQARNGSIGIPTMPAAQVTNLIGITGCSAAMVSVPNSSSQCSRMSVRRFPTHRSMVCCICGVIHGLIRPRRREMAEERIADAAHAEQGAAKTERRKSEPVARFRQAHRRQHHLGRDRKKHGLENAQHKQDQRRARRCGPAQGAFVQRLEQFHGSTGSPRPESCRTIKRLPAATARTPRCTAFPDPSLPRSCASAAGPARSYHRRVRSARHAHAVAQAARSRSLHRPRSR